MFVEAEVNETLGNVFMDVDQKAGKRVMCWILRIVVVWIMSLCSFWVVPKGVA
jgi:hypothetical protein